MCPRCGGNEAGVPGRFRWRRCAYLRHFQRSTYADGSTKRSVPRECSQEMEALLQTTT